MGHASFALTISILKIREMQTLAKQPQTVQAS